MASGDNYLQFPDQVEAEAASLPLPEAFLNFLEENGLDPAIYSPVEMIPRYIRLKPGCESQLPNIESELKCKLKSIDWLPSFFSIPPHIQIAGSQSYQQGKIYGMDAASGAAVLALNVSPGNHILDLCAAPGAKLCMLSDLLGCSGSLTGVDIARHRLAACRTMLQKYKLGDRCRLFVADGTSFSLFPLRVPMEMGSYTDTSASKEFTEVFKEWSSKRPWKDRKNANKVRNACLSSVPAEPELIFYGIHSGVVGLFKSELFRIDCDSEASYSGYDRVLVDAECTHDGSVKHIQKFEQWGWKTLQRRVLDAQRLDNLVHLQLQLLTNGFKLLKVGGSLVYSTCSLTVAQNEEVLELFLSRNPSADMIFFGCLAHWPRSWGSNLQLRIKPQKCAGMSLQLIQHIVAREVGAGAPQLMSLRTGNLVTNHLREPIDQSLEELAKITK